LFDHDPSLDALGRPAILERLLRMSNHIYVVNPMPRGHGRA
jgi:hypothetical protein